MNRSSTARAQGKESNDRDILTAARSVVEIESDAVRQLAGCLDAKFEEAVRMIAGAPGHVIVTGMGKSGHIGRKIAATLASTGTPAFFVHPGEASHGDLGMVTHSNVVIAISNSGETSELSDLVVYTRRFEIPLIGITSRAESTLGRRADVALVLPKMEEACPLGLAPTTSTTLTLVLGDALAVALLSHKGFTHEGFRDFHPGGRLGNVLQRVRDIMHSAERMPVAQLGERMGEVLIRMSAGGFGCVGVFDGQEVLVGIVTDGDLRRHMSPDFVDLAVEEVMSPHPQTIAAGALAAEALKLMTESRINGLFVVDSGNDRVPVGFLHLHDCLRSGVY
ncbi:MAG: KpsF/GutQ family sugar-phosphate isomerase [Tistlia sp.]|uniref:SIS domain-containing protein n=1 Tax=Tistlia sp. TaxID=3057121 RepID=UPI0034A2B406